MQEPLKLVQGQLLDQAPAQPSWQIHQTIYYPQNWVMAIAGQICAGETPDESEDAIGVDSQGDLVLYRKLGPADWAKFPLMYGLREIWISFRLQPSE